MTTPIYDFVKKYAESGGTRLHMPGHKGVPYLGCEKYDITEILGADVLYSAEGIIAESENNVSRLFGAAHSFYSTQGSTLAICAMLALVSRRSGGEGKPTILAARNVHTAFVKAAALLDLDVEWLYPEEETHLCSCNITAENLRETLEKMSKKPRAVYVTSPDYLGNMLDISALSEVCREFSVPLLVDNAHGAYLKFLPEDRHPITLGAAMCADSAHKTLPVLTGGAYLHISKEYEAFCADARWAMSLFASTSPSYLTLCSLDLCNKRLSEDYSRRLSETCREVEKTKDALAELGFFIEETEPLKIVINANSSCLQSEDIAEALRRANIEPEFVDGNYVVLMPSADTAAEDLARVRGALEKINDKKRITELQPLYLSLLHEKAMSIRDAVISKSEYVDAEKSAGRICAAPTVSCPPAVPVVISGEKIKVSDVRIFKYYGIKKVCVVCEM